MSGGVKRLEGKGETLMETTPLAHWLSGKGLSKCDDLIGDKMKQMVLGGEGGWV